MKSAIRQRNATMSDDPIERWIEDAIEADPQPEISEHDDDDAGPPLSPEDLLRGRAELGIWQVPDTFRQQVDNLTRRSRSSEFFNDPQHKFLRDAWTLAEFTRHKRVDQVRLTAEQEQWPDGQVQIGGEIINIEITIALVPGRRLGAEYRFPGRTELDPVENWIERAAVIPGALDNAIAGKVAKRYASPAWLLVYLNISEYGIRQEETEAAIADIKRRYAGSFAALYVLWKDKLL
jgi:hypothetical protein